MTNYTNLNLLKLDPRKISSNYLNFQVAFENAITCFKDYSNKRVSETIAISNEKYKTLLRVATENKINFKNT